MALTKITSGVIAPEFTTSANLVSGTSVSVDWNSAQIFRITPNHAVTFSFNVRRATRSLWLSNKNYIGL